MKARADLGLQIMQKLWFVYLPIIILGVARLFWKKKGD
jgi:hypothetical protein